MGAANLTRFSRRAWPGLIIALIVIGLLLAWADGTIFRQLFPQLPAPPGRFPERAPMPFGRLLGPRVLLGTPRVIGGAFSFWWFVGLGIGLVSTCLLGLTLFPGRARVMVDRLQASGGVAIAVAGGVATLLLIAAATIVFRLSLVLLPLVGALWTGGLLAALFGLASLGLAIGRALRLRLGEAHPLIATLAGTLVIYDVALIPVAGAALFALFTLAGLGLTVVTRLGSPYGWGLEELRW